MGIRSVDVSINDQTYTYNTYTAKRGLNVLRRLTAIVGPGFAKLTAGVEDETVGPDTIPEVVTSLVSRMDSDEIENLILDMTNEVYRGNVPIDFNMEFAGNYGTLVQLLISIVKENYSSLFTQSGLNGILTASPIR